MFASMFFDVEDYTTPARHGMDDIPMRLAEIMTEEKVPGTFLVIGNKARSLRDRSRKDVIRAMARHEIGSHTDNGSHHPTLSEYLAGLDWDKGVSLCREKEMRHVRELEEIFGKPVGCFSRHGGNFAPQHTWVAGEAGLPIIYSHAGLPPHSIAWYCGAINFCRDIEISEKSYAKSAELEKTLARWDEQIEKATAEGCQWLGAFMAHPLMIKCVQFNDALNFADGRNRTPWLTPDFVPPKEVRAAFDGFRRACRFLREHKRLKLAPVKAVADEYSGVIRRIGRNALVERADRAASERKILQGDRVSAGELVLAFAEAILGAKDHVLPEHVPVKWNIPGPMEEPSRRPDCDWLSWGQIVELAKRLTTFAKTNMYLPANLPVPDMTPPARIGLGVLYLLLADAIRAMAAGRPGRLRVRHIGPAYPDIAFEIDARARRGYLGWIIFDQYMPTEKLLRYTRLQSWTHKIPSQRGEQETLL
ncbi:MAG: hypothetical protein N3A38_05680 [Planctomycetota bacterium]|nr:hypothetical protein [Planctomycetota bacterium]